MFDILNIKIPLLLFFILFLCSSKFNEVTDPDFIHFLPFFILPCFLLILAINQFSYHPCRGYQTSVPVPYDRSQTIARRETLSLHIFDILKAGTFFLYFCSALVMRYNQAELSELTSSFLVLPTTQYADQGERVIQPQAARAPDNRKGQGSLRCTLQFS